ncbi:hypothetical protein KFK14_13075 [Sphingobium phenoxybenzoativorans]|uniref:Uncharacterized protein n=1 Tax=Sphingobium phenoxybenzoativorans TaxID=1592790 RepID=A0A975K377_9SPHN|nr:hypothetical protein [Sphingobium phenoxybenzoativorans]QUT04079.1 hypothetical protein KFK14_13075 [Sphingobium phenoxybenzoativorans]
MQAGEAEFERAYGRFVYWATKCSEAERLGRDGEALIDHAIERVCAAVDSLVGIPAVDLQQLGNKFDAVMQHGDWRDHAAAVLADIRRLDS